LSAVVSVVPIKLTINCDAINGVCCTGQTGHGSVKFQEGGGAFNSAPISCNWKPTSKARARAEIISSFCQFLRKKIKGKNIRKINKITNKNIRSLNVSNIADGGGGLA